jgi:hypothetical protein
MGATNQPHGGTIMDLYLNEAAATAEKQQARDYSQFTKARKPRRGAGTPSASDRGARRPSWCSSRRMRMPAGSRSPLRSSLRQRAAAGAGLRPKYARRQHQRDDSPRRNICV